MKISSGATYSRSCTRKHARRPGRAADRTAPSASSWSARAGSSRRAATCRGRRQSGSAVQRTAGTRARARDSRQPRLVPMRRFGQSVGPAVDTVAPGALFDSVPSRSLSAARRQNWSASARQTKRESILSHSRRRRSRGRAGWPEPVARGGAGTVTSAGASKKRGHNAGDSSGNHAPPSAVRRRRAEDATWPALQRKRPRCSRRLARDTTKGAPMVKHAIQLGEPVEHRGIVIAPLFPRVRPARQYVTLDEALPLGFHVTEVDAAGSVPELAVDNPLDSDVLLYDGEELLGAKQNRILNVTVLVGARSKTRIPVSCVEEGRWSSRSAQFGAASHTPTRSCGGARRRRCSRRRSRAAPRSRTSGSRCADKARAHERASRRPARRRTSSPSARTISARSAKRSRSSRPDRRAARDRRPALPRLRVAAGRVRAPLPEAAERLPARRGRAARRQAGGRGGARRVPRGGRGGAPLAARRRRRSARTCGSPATASSAPGLELDGELLQLSVFSADGEKRPATRIAPAVWRR